MISKGLYHGLYYSLCLLEARCLLFITDFTVMLYHCKGWAPYPPFPPFNRHQGLFSIPAEVPANKKEGCNSSPSWGVAIVLDVSLLAAMMHREMDQNIFRPQTKGPMLLGPIQTSPVFMPTYPQAMRLLANKDGALNASGSWSSHNNAGVSFSHRYMP